MRRIALALVVAANALVLAQETQKQFCAVSMSVKVGGAGPLASGTALLIDDRGSTVQTTEIKNGQAAFCDFGFGSHSIRVQPSDGIPVTLSGVRLVYGVEQHLQVIVNPESDIGSQGGGGNACSAYIRLTSVDGSPVPKATALRDGSVFRADAYGRLLLLVPLGRFTTFRFEQPGFQPREETLSCSKWYEVIQRRVTLIR